MGRRRREEGAVTPCCGHRLGMTECEVAGVRLSLCRLPRSFRFFSCRSLAAFSIMSWGGEAGERSVVLLVP